MTKTRIEPGSHPSTLGHAVSCLLVALAATGCGAPPPPTTATGAASSAAAPGHTAAAANPPGASTAQCERPITPAQRLAREADRMAPVDMNGALAKYEEATKLDPTDHRIFFELAMALKKSDRWADVVSTMRRATALAPGFATYWVELGRAQEALAKRKAGSFEDAKKAYLTCVEIDPWLADCHERIGHVLLWTDDERGAIERYTEAIRREPDALRHHLPLADLYIRLDHVAEAEAVLRDAVRRAKPDDSSLFAVHSMLASVHQDKGNLEEMVAELEAAKAVAPEGVEADLTLFSLGLSYAVLAPPRVSESVTNLRAFYARRCLGSDTKAFRTNCASAATLIQRFGGAVPAAGDASAGAGGAPKASQASKSAAPASAGASAAGAPACGEPPGPYQPRPAYAGPAPSLPAIPALWTGPVKIGDAYTVRGLMHHLRSRAHSDEVTSKPISVVGYVVRTNFEEAPPCAVHRTGQGDPVDCRSPLPSFAIADAKGEKTRAIDVMGWASNFAQIYSMIEAIDKAPKGQAKSVRLADGFTGVDLPNPLPSPGAKVRVTGTYGVSFQGQGQGQGQGSAANPKNGIVTAERIETLDDAPTKATLPGMKPRR
ncbi:tetratricopeptide repeat protein [Sorangium sp. So ce426]|uniref:tetratricopeptide repeat protein n=1 Tax=Sorangium sp. So ce426 TaxID=3133312 RepID=UPI003F5BD486